MWNWRFRFQACFSRTEFPFSTHKPAPGLRNGDLSRDETRLGDERQWHRSLAMEKSRLSAGGKNGNGIYRPVTVHTPGFAEGASGCDPLA